MNLMASGYQLVSSSEKTSNSDGIPEGKTVPGNTKISKAASIQKVREQMKPKSFMLCCDLVSECDIFVRDFGINPFRSAGEKLVTHARLEMFVPCGHHMESKKTTGCLDLFMTILCIISIPMVVQGAVFLYKCPAQPDIPIFLIVGGIAIVIRHICRCWVILNNKRCFNLNIATYLFLTPLWIIGSAWTFSNHLTNNVDPKNPGYCNETMYLPAFWLLNSMYIIVGILMITARCLSSRHYDSRKLKGRNFTFIHPVEQSV